jgi:hypothetical protein
LIEKGGYDGREIDRTKEQHRHHTKFLADSTQPIISININAKKLSLWAYHKLGSEEHQHI